MKAGVQYDVDYLMTAMRRAEHRQSTVQPDNSFGVSTDILSCFPWLKNLILFCQNSMSVEAQNDLSFLSSFIENIANNLTKSPHHNRYSHLIEQFVFALYVLGGRQAYEFVRINLPRSLPSLSTLSNLLNQSKEPLKEGDFCFDSMTNHLKSMKVKYAFTSKDCTGIIKKVCYDCQSNSFVGFCPPLHNNDFPRPSIFRTESFSDLEETFRSETFSSLLNIHAIQPITRLDQRSSPFLVSAYGTDNKFDSYHLIRRWMKIFDESLRRGIRIVGFSTDCDS